MNDCLISFGANLGDPTQQFQTAIEMLNALPETVVLNASGLLETRPVGNMNDQPNYFNAAILLRSGMMPFQLLFELLKIETAIGRVRQRRWAPRSIDLDLLICGCEVVETAELLLPHPRMSFRRFMLQPSVEIAPKMVHPISGLTIAELLQHLDMKRNIVLVVAAPNRLETIKQELSGSTYLPCHSNNWLSADVKQYEIDSTVDGDDCHGMIPINSLDEFLDWSVHAKLVIVDPQDLEHELLTFATGFRGPMYRLPTFSESQIAREILAAIEATRPI